MVTEQEKGLIRECAEKFNVRSVILFGSSLEREDARDIDLAVEGIEPSLFFKFYAEIVKRLSRPVDLVDLSDDCLFTRLVAENGVRLYG